MKSASYHKTVLDNGITLLSERAPSRTVSLGIWINAGSRDEADKASGAAHFLEHMLFKGTASRDAGAIARDIDRLGGLANAFTTKEHTCLYGTVLDAQLPRLVELLSDIFLNSLFPDDETERERQVVLQEIGMALDTPEDLIHDLLADLMWAGHPLARPVLGRPEVVAAMTSARLRRFRARCYRPSQVVVAAAGNVDHKRLAALLGPLAAWQAAGDATTDRARQAPTPRPAPGLAIHPKRLEQTHLLLGAYGPPAATEERYTLALLNTVLGGNMSSRLFQEVREKRGLAYSIYSFADGLSDAGLIGIYAGIGHETVNQVRDLIEGVVRDLRQQPLAAEELRAAQDFATAGVVLAEESMEARMMRLAKNELTLGHHLPIAEVEAALMRVRATEVTELAGRLLAEPLSGVVLGPIRPDDCRPEPSLLEEDEDD